VNQDNSSTVSETYKFTGKPVSQTTGLYYYLHRWYDPTIGRFISPDPLAGRRADPQSLNPYVYVENAPTSSTDPTGMADCGWNPLSWGGCAENAGGVAWNGLTTAGTDIQNGWNSLSPEEQQGIILAGLVALTFATGGTDLLVVGAVGFAIGAGGYTGITVATGGTPTLQGALFWGTVGFGAATAIASLPSIGPRVMSTLGLRGAAEATAETGFSATRYSDYFIKSDHLQDIAGKFVGDRLDFQSAENLIGNTLSTGQLTEVDGNFQTYEQVFGTLSGKPMGLRVIWNVLDWEVRNAYLFPV
jgi:RHS repeat-associated protein